MSTLRTVYFGWKWGRSTGWSGLGWHHLYQQPVESNHEEKVSYLNQQDPLPRVGPRCKESCRSTPVHWSRPVTLQLPWVHTVKSCLPRLWYDTRESDDRFIVVSLELRCSDLVWQSLSVVIFLSVGFLRDLVSQDVTWTVLTLIWKWNNSGALNPNKHYRRIG